MLSFILAPSGYGKTHTVISEIKELIDRNEEKKIYVIVPEQESVKMEFELLEVCKNKINTCVEVINFSRLANRVFREAGGMTYKYIDKAGKDIMTAVILERMKSACPAFANVSGDTKYVQLMRTEMDTLRSRGIHSADIVKVKNKLSEKDSGGAALYQKLDDFAAIFSAYEKALKDNITDTTDDIVRLAETLGDFDFFENTYVFVDGFYDFTVPQYDVMEKIMKSCNKMTVTLSMARPDPEEIFRKTSYAFDILRQRAEKNSIEYTCTELKKNYRTVNEGIKALSQAITTGEEICFGNSDGVTVTRTGSPYEECVFVAREIVKLVKNGVRFSEIAVCAANIASYASNLENVFDSYGISHLNCTERSIVQMPVISLVLSALDVINSSFYSQHMKSYLKSNYLGLTEDEAYLLENYITLWNIGKKSWYSEEEWTMHPRGYVEKLTSTDRAELEIVNRARHKVFPPLKKLEEGFSDRSSVLKKAQSLVGFFDDLSLSKQVGKYNAELAQSFGEADFDDEISAWNSLLDSLDIMVEGAGELSIGKDRFIKYLRLVLSDYSFGKIPSSLDEVEMGDVEFVRNKNIKHLFFIGFNEGVFPSASESKSVFTESEKKWLYENDIKLDDSAEDKLKDQAFHFLLAVLRPSQSLHFVFHTSSSESAKAVSLPSYFYSYLKETLGTEIEENTDVIPVVPHELREYLVACDADMSDCFTGEDEQFYKEAMLLKDFAARTQKPFRIELDTDIIPFEYNLTQSRLERYEKCRFSYFVEYMMNARTRKKAEFSRAEIGSYVHKILETVLKSLTESGQSITEAPRDMIEELTVKCAAEYIEAVASNINENSPKYKYLMDNICSFVLLIIENIREEFSSSLFKPRYFEENIRDSDVVKPYEVKLNDGGKLFFYGVVDRVDSYIDDTGTEYIRVVDYKTKTGGKSFSLEDVINGMNLQMLIYLYAFTNTPSQNPRAEAGIMYMPASKEEFKPTDKELGDCVLRAQIDKKLMRSGMYLDDRRIIDAMEIGEEKRFVGLKYDKKLDEYASSASSTLATVEEFGIIQRYIDMLFRNVMDDMKAGRIEADPIEENNSGGSACSYCLYHPICRFEGEPRQKIKCDKPLLKMREDLGETENE